MRYRYALWMTAAMLVGAVAGSLLGPRPAEAVAKEIIQIQSDVGLLLQGQRDMQNSMAQNQGVLKTLVQQSNDEMTQLSTSVTGSVDKLTAALDSFQKSMADSRANSGSRLDTMSTQVQGLSDNLDEIRGRLGKIDQQLVDLQNSVRDMDSKLTTSIAAPPAGAPATPSVASTSTTPLPSADVLYSNGYRDLIAGNYDLAQQEFQTYVKDYPGTELASNAQFYLGEIAFVQKKFDDAVAAYDTVLQKYPNSFKRPSARFKKGLALIALGRKQAGISELRGVIHDYPGTDEAKLATARLHQIGVPVKTPSH